MDDYIYHQNASFKLLAEMSTVNFISTNFRTGHLNIWVVVEVVNPDPYGSEADLGLVPGGRVKLVKSTSINVASQPASRATER